MEITYRALDLSSDADCELLCRWNNDPALKHLYNRFPDQESSELVFGPESFRRSGPPSDEGRRRTLVVLVDGLAAGQACLEFDTPKLLHRDSHTAWIALIVGEEQFRGCGLGKRIVEHLETLAAEAGAHRVEIGVFEYNSRALQFFGGLGYEEFRRRPERAWWQGRLWAEVRLLKAL